MLISLSPLLQKANASQFAVGAFNVTNFEMMQIVIQTAADCRSPVIVSTSSVEARYFDPAVAYAMAAALAQKYHIPIVLHLDHGDSFDIVMACLRAGYTSIMYDGSQHPLDENIRITKEVARAAHAVGVSVEGEVGRIQGAEDDLEVSEAEAALSDVAEARRFVHETGVDALAVAIGNAHGFYAQAPNLDFERLRVIRRNVNIPMVLHGGTGLPVEQIQRAIKLGIAKINIASRVRRAYMSAIYDDLLQHPDTTEVRDVMRVGTEAMAAEIKASMEMMGSIGKLALE